MYRTLKSFRNSDKRSVRAGSEPKSDVLPITPQNRKLMIFHNTIFFLRNLLPAADLKYFSLLTASILLSNSSK
jgi:hypothetical protein